jgi:hypothetical protein
LENKSKEERSEGWIWNGRGKEVEVKKSASPVRQETMVKPRTDQERKLKVNVVMLMSTNHGTVRG